MKNLVFDSGPIVSLTTNNLLWLLEPLKEKFGGEFYISESVVKELVHMPLSTKKYKFEALQVEQLIEIGILNEVKSEKIRKEAFNLLKTANSIFSANSHPMKIVQYAEMETLAAAKVLDAKAIVIDERVTRTLIEYPESLHHLMERRLNRKLKFNKTALKEFSVKIPLIRSAELAAVAYDLGFLNKFLVSVPRAKKELLDSLLWGVKLNGCSITDTEIREIVKIVLG